MTAHKDHPRIRGEHPSLLVGLLGCAWIIPAYAGSTSLPFAPGRSLTDHPRIRGEHCMALRQLARPFGSSPHTRGALCRRR